MICRSGSQMRRMIAASVYSGCRRTTGSMLSSSSRVAWWNSVSPGLRARISSKIGCRVGLRAVTRLLQAVATKFLVAVLQKG
ncbi:hypothetical protein D9M69_702720 [compost metagenome]